MYKCLFTKKGILVIIILYTLLDALEMLLGQV